MRGLEVEAGSVSGGKLKLAPYVLEHRMGRGFENDK